MTNLIKQRKCEDRYNVYIDDEFCFSANVEDITRNSIKIGNQYNSNELEQLIDTCEESKAYNYCLYLLGIRDYTKSELERKLHDREYSSHTVITVLEKLKLYGIINDKRYVEKYINDSQKLRKVGMKKVLYNLEKKGISRSELNEIDIDKDIEFDNAFNLALKKLKSLSGKDKQKEKLYRHLISKGYDFEVIKKAINRIFTEEWEDI